MPDEEFAIKMLAIALIILAINIFGDWRRNKNE